MRGRGEPGCLFAPKVRVVLESWGSFPVGGGGGSLSERDGLGSLVEEQAWRF